MSIRIQASNATVKALQARLQDAYRRDDVRLVRRTSVLLELLTQTATVPVLCERWGLSPSCLYAWQKACLLRGLASLIYRHSGGRPAKLTPSQKKRLVELIEAGPLVVGLETACWNSGLIRVLIWREFGILYNRHYVCTFIIAIMSAHCCPTWGFRSKRPVLCRIIWMRPSAWRGCRTNGRRLSGQPSVAKG